MAALNPMEDPLRSEERTPEQVGRRLKPSERAEFAPVDVSDIRERFDQTQEEFARMMGISVDTLRNWERGRRHPQGPARALLRIADSDPALVARVLSRHRVFWKPEEEEARAEHVERLLEKRAHARALREKAERAAAQKSAAQKSQPEGAGATDSEGDKEIEEKDDLDWLLGD